MSEYTSDWFSQNIPSWDKIFSALRPARILEIGSYEGRSAVWCAEKQIAMGIDGRIICIDTWEGGAEHEKDRMSEVEDRFWRNTQRFNVSRRKGRSIDILQDIGSREAHDFDLVYIDGSHVAKDVLTDAVLAYPLLRKDGFMIFDDYLWRGFDNPLDCPGMAIDAFAQIFSREMAEVRDFPLYQRYFVKQVA